MKVPSEDCFFWSIHGQAELDLLIFKDGKRLGFEFKYSDVPAITKSMRSALEYLHLDALTIISPGTHHYPLDEKIQAMGLMALAQQNKS